MDTRLEGVLRQTLRKTYKETNIQTDNLALGLQRSIETEVVFNTYL